MSQFLSEKIRAFKRSGTVPSQELEKWALEVAEMERKLGRIRFIASDYQKSDLFSDLDQRPVREPEDFEQLP